MAPEDNKVLVRRMFEEVWTQGNIDAADQFFAPNYIIHNPADPSAQQRGPESVKQFVTAARTAFPDILISVEEIITEGEKVATRYTWRGTQKGPLWNIPPTGRQVMVTGILISRLVDGRFAEDWGVVDMLGLVNQLGVVPPPGQTRS